MEQVLIIMALVVTMVAGLLMTRVMKLIKLPNVTGYLIAGVICNIVFVKLLNIPDVDNGLIDSFSIITTVALGFVAFSIGGEFKLSTLKQVGSRVFVITVFEALSSVALVMVSLFVVKIFIPAMEVSFILIMGAIAAATAPAATLMVVRQYKAHGPVTDTLLPVVALDDAVALMTFSLCVSIARSLSGGGDVSILSVIVAPLWEIIKSFAVGLIAGGLLALCCKFFRSRANRLCWMIASVLLCVALSDLIGLSSLLTCMMLGASFANFRMDSIKILEGCERWTPPLFMLFFVFSGIELDMSIIPSIGAVGIIYLIARSLGKYLGAMTGSVITKADSKVKKYLGLTLIPQAGVAIGMATMLSQMPEFSHIAGQITTVVLCGTLIYELVGPILTKIALTKAGEITDENKLLSALHKSHEAVGVSGTSSNASVGVTLPDKESVSTETSAVKNDGQDKG